MVAMRMPTYSNSNCRATVFSTNVRETVCNATMEMERHLAMWRLYPVFRQLTGAGAPCLQISITTVTKIFLFQAELLNGLLTWTISDLFLISTIKETTTKPIST